MYFEPKSMNIVECKWKLMQYKKFPLLSPSGGHDGAAACVTGCTKLIKYDDKKYDDG